jgi:hypothetical protein
MKTTAQARANLETSISYIPARYIEGVSAADWQGPAGSEQAEKNFAAEMAKVISGKKRQTGVKAVPNSDWQEAAKKKGGDVIGERIRLALDDWQAEFGPIYDQVVTKVKSLPPSTTDFRANITARLVPTVEAWKKGAGKL